MLSPRSL